MAISLDFDGVIHSYERGWDDGTIYGTVLRGGYDAIRQLMDEHAVFVLTCRDVVQVAQWIQRHLGIPVQADLDFDGGFWNARGVLLVTNRKLPALAYVDDRAVRFESWEQALAELKGGG